MNFSAEQLEREFVELAARKAGSTDAALKAFAVKVWHDKDEKRAHEKIKLLTEGYPKKGGVPQRLVLGDALRMAQALELPLGYLLALTEENLKRKAQGLEPY